MAEYSDQASFNIGMAYAMGLYGKLQQISSAFVNQESHRAEMLLRALYREMACKLKTQEREKVQKLFTDLGTLYQNRRVIIAASKNPYSSKKINYNKLVVKNLENIFAKLEQIDILLRDYLESKGLLIPSKKDRTRFENLE